MWGKSPDPHFSSHPIICPTMEETPTKPTQQGKQPRTSKNPRKDMATFLDQYSVEVLEAVLGILKAQADSKDES